MEKVARRIFLSDGQSVAWVDHDDYSSVSEFSWSLSSHCPPYAQRQKKTARGWKSISMHREIIGAGIGQFVDHLDHEKLNNRRNNLGRGSSSENMHNRVKHKNNTSGFIGVCLDKQTAKWRAAIKSGGKKISCGSFETKEVAAMAYDAAKMKLHGRIGQFNLTQDRTGDTHDGRST